MIVQFCAFQPRIVKSVLKCMLFFKKNIWTSSEMTGIIGCHQYYSHTPCLAFISPDTQSKIHIYIWLYCVCTYFYIYKESTLANIKQNKTKQKKNRIKRYKVALQWLIKHRCTIFFLCFFFIFLLCWERKQLISVTSFGIVISRAPILCV